MLRKQAATGFLWTFTQQFGNQLIGFVVSVVLARVLLPSDFGLIGMIGIFISVGQSLVHSGLSQSLIRASDPKEQDFSTVFYFNLVASIVVYILTFFLAPFIANFYGHQILVPLIRVYTVIFIINGLTVVQLAIFTRNMDFRTPALTAIPANVIGGIVGITLALNDFGVWSIVLSQIVNNTSNTLQLWIYSKWRPRSIFNRKSFKDHFNFGYKLTLTGLIDTIFRNSYYIIIGKIFSPAQVGFYTRAETMKQLPVSNLSSALNSVTYPLFAAIHQDNIRLKKIYKDLMEIVISVITPVLVFIGILAEPTFEFLFTSKWLPAVPYFQILCVTGILLPIHSYNLNVLKVKGRTDLILRLEIIKKTIVVFTILVTVQFGIIALLYGQVFISLVSFFINAYYTEKFLRYSALEQIRDIGPLLFLSFFSGFFLYLFDQNLTVDLSNLLRIILGSLVGAIIYITLIFIFKKRIILLFLKLISQK